MHAQGLEVVSLMFEHFGDFAQAAAATRRFRDKFGIEYTTLIAGTSDRDDAARALPQLNGVFAYPTTVWVDRTGQVRKIHAGFSGPATGLHYEELVSEFTEFTRELLAEAEIAPAPISAGVTTINAAAWRRPLLQFVWPPDRPRSNSLNAGASSRSTRVVRGWARTSSH
jgi:hypothetical protein